MYILISLSCPLQQWDLCMSLLTQVYTTSTYTQAYADMQLLCHIPYSGYFSRGNIFVKVVILAISWKKFRGRAVALKPHPFWARACTRYVQTVLEDRGGSGKLLFSPIK